VTHFGIDTLSPDYQNVDACTSFDHLVCDGFTSSHEIPEDRTSYSTLGKMSDDGQAIIKRILQGEYPGESKVCSAIILNSTLIVAM
jgi:endothelin-converting enzyme